MNSGHEIRSIWKLVALHLFPGIVLSIVYIFLLNSESLTEYPKVVTLGIAGFFSILPIELGYLLYVAKKETGKFNIFKVMGLKSKMKVKEYAVYTLLLLSVAGILMKALQPFSNYILNTVFHWLPNDYNYVQDMSLFSKNFILIAIAVSFFFLTLILPITEELYFRGFLLARMKWMGKYSVLVNLLLFAVYHFWSPWLIVARIVAFLPLFYLVYKKDSLKLGIAVHCLANFTDVAALVMLL
ncbi:CPBP family intramembrane glutamic endopeptidase [Paenibacillus sp. MMS20-IR301]|uniref:CPBP family intramembrane glutamic endopeptidase n=1 Tax=Paenibacillus sp. MMS20-IR301 TaxID=2895946 RepID=UPI0028EBF640|nr:CPBP family intramembrane glutamic endopeptidase [Paenibacillus sp. MMS20-IR301]WNS42304.1 CPBP family intramembrane glutamic endopeptidase [Paenibacillus sp. MMS20-IR301]